MIHLDDVLALLAVRSGSCILHEFHSVISRNDVCKLKECGLENRVDSAAQTDLFCNLHAVDGIEFDLLFGNGAFHLTRKLFIQLVEIPAAVQQERTALIDVGNHIVLVDIGRIMTCDKISLVN